MRLRAFLFSIILLLSLVFLLSPHAYAAEADAAEGLLDRFAEILPDAAREGLEGDIDADAVREAVGFRHLFSMLLAALTGATEHGGTVGKLFGTVLLFSSVALIGSFFGKSRLSDIFFAAAPALFLYRILSPAIDRALAFLEELSAFASLLSPLFVSVFSAGGALGGAAVASGGFAVFIGILESVVLSVLSPLLKILLALALLSPFSLSSLTGEIEKRIRASFVWILSVISFLLSASLAFESSLASSADSVALRATKFTVGQSIPIVGGAISSMLGALSSSLSLVKSTFGAGALLALLSLLFPVLAELILLRLTLSLSSLAASAMGASGISTVCERYRGILDLLLAAVSITGAMFLLLTGILSRAGAV